MSSSSAAKGIEVIGQATGRPRRIGRRVGAVVAGLLVNVVAGTGTDAVLHATGVYPQLGVRMAGALFALALAYRVAYGVLGSYVTARLAPDRPVLHAMALGAVGVAIGSIGAVVMWNAGPAWYALGVIAVTLPCARAGAWLYERGRGGAAGGRGRVARGQRC